MKPGSVIIDLAVERGGNCPLSKPDEIVVHKGVSIIGTVNLAGKLAGNATPCQPDAVTVVSERLVFKPRLTPVALLFT